MTPRKWHPYAALCALGLLLGPVHAYIVPAANDALFRHDLAAESLSSFAAALLLLTVSKRQASAASPQRSRAIWILLLPVFAGTALHSHAIPILPQHEIPWGAAAALTLASPLWLALLAACQLIATDVPRMVAGSAMLAVGTVFLVLETSAYALAVNDLQAFLVALALSILTVYTWFYVASRVRNSSPAGCAARYLFLRAAFDGALSLALERTSLHDVAWREALLLLALDAVLTATAMFLWFWLLQNLQLAAFALHPLAIWTASLIGGLLTFGLANWRMDTAAAIALAALVFGLRARIADEQPLALELG